jgi:hypothetical protein
MALLVLAGIFAGIGVFVAVMAIRFRQGRAEQLRDRASYRASLWPAARRSIPYGLFPIAGILLLTAASMAAGAAGAEGVGFSAIYLLLLLALLVLAAVLMIRKPRWVDPHRDAPRPPAEWDPADEPPRPIAEMTGKELAEWARDDPDKLRRLMRRYKR